ncbi:TetR/AcrR family transcriptional regulator [Alteraurantiacibacter buctensis]|uniref:TetR family transcriptional regulator n=1 Tax=Alteraurantiacibacter buctensis TaxID=1503981 RepID=A0A844YZD9_9SPHN|nr:TetR/AcrR family transcriptional regulator [Alteraurantiacibacter buctensis]MXO71834.1 TetR family transcriptional regulator [Alteraurantiacibacter buctensis]
MAQSERTRGRPRKNEIDSVQAIMDSAVPIFAAKGFDATNLREIADDAGVNMALVSYNFGSKLDLWKRIIEIIGQKIEAAQMLLAKTTGFSDPGTTLRAAMSAYIGFMAARPDAARFMVRDIDHDPERAQWIYDHVTRRLLDQFLPLIARAKADGAISAAHPEMTFLQFAFGTAACILRRDRLTQDSPEFSDDGRFRAALHATLVEPLFHGD